MLSFQNILAASPVYLFVYQGPFVLTFVFSHHDPLLILLIAALLGWHNKLISIFLIFKLIEFFNL
jgi:hypothetical protein